MGPRPASVSTPYKPPTPETRVQIPDVPMEGTKKNILFSGPAHSMPFSRVRRVSLITSGHRKIHTFNTPLTNSTGQADVMHPRRRVADPLPSLCRKGVPSFNHILVALIVAGVRYATIHLCCALRVVSRGDCHPTKNRHHACCFDGRIDQLLATRAGRTHISRLLLSTDQPHKGLVRL